MRTKVSSGAQPQPSAADQLAKDVGKERPRAASAAQQAQSQAQQRLVVPHDVVNEQIVIAASLADTATLKWLQQRAKPDDFFGKGHAEIWTTLGEMARQGLEYSPAVVRQFSGGKVDEAYLTKLAQLHKGAPPNIRHHIEQLGWEKARIEASRGPLPELLRLFQDTRTAPETMRAAIKKLGVAFDGYGDRRYLLDPNELVRQQSDDILKRRQGYAVYPFGLDGLDIDEQQQHRMIPGAAPGLITVVTAVPGGGKSTMVARMALGLIELGRRVLYGAWEMSGGVTLELLAGMALGLSRKRVKIGAITDDEHQQLYDKMIELSAQVRFLAMPFGRVRGEKVSNDKNLDLIHGYIADSGADVAIFDLWKRCLRETDPDDEEHALIRQQAIAEETKCHCILVQQQRFKDIEGRKDKRPTRDGIKGSGAWVEVPDTILAPHRPALFKRVPDDTLEVIVLKQRWGEWPLAVAFDWEAEYGSIRNGRTVDYDVFDDANTEQGDEGFFGKKAGKR